MGRKPYADIPGHKKFDADLREVINLARRLAADAPGKATRAGSDKERAAFEQIGRAMEKLAAEAQAARMALWDGTG